MGCKAAAVRLSSYGSGMARAVVVAVATVLALAGAGYSQEQQRVRLATGEILTVEILEITEEQVRFRHPVLGEIAVGRVVIEILDDVSKPPAVEQQRGSNGDTSGGAAKGEARPSAETPGVIAPEPPPQPVEKEKLWKFKLTLSGSLTSGNTDTGSFAAVLSGRRETVEEKFVFDAGYFFGQSRGERTDSRATAGFRQDWLNPDSKWFFFADGRYTFDEFQSWDHRVTGHIGVGYKLLEPPKWKVNLLGGVGAVKEWGSENEDLRPEGLVGAEGVWQIAERHSLNFSSIAYPSLLDPGEFRWVNSSNWSWIVDEKSNLSVTAGVLHEYQSQVDPGRKRNDLRLYAGLGIDF